MNKLRIFSLVGLAFGALPLISQFLWLGYASEYFLYFLLAIGITFSLFVIVKSHNGADKKIAYVGLIIGILEVLIIIYANHFLSLDSGTMVCNNGICQLTHPGWGIDLMEQMTKSKAG